MWLILYPILVFTDIWQIIKFRKSKRKECYGKITEEKIGWSNPRYDIRSKFYTIKCEYMLDGKSYAHTYSISTFKNVNLDILGKTEKVYYKENDYEKVVTEYEYRRYIHDVATFFLILIIFFGFLLLLKY